MHVPVMQDVDIDVNDQFNPKRLFDQFTHASMIRQGKLAQHPVGLYFQSIPTDPWNQRISAIPYSDAEEHGFQKIDFLHLTFLDAFDDKEELRQLAKKEPNWALLNHRSNVVKLFHISNHFDVVDRIKPKSIEDLADVVALIRPGKRNLLERYVNERDYVRSFLYKKTDQYYFKRSHAIGYAMVIAVQLHLIAQGKL